ncbi:MAG TPA: rhomboid family intramembrane serine protease [Anaerolineales bacterium]|nr:rhomboid family intramembrane serine protease [Anaerolineales bacterium]
MIPLRDENPSRSFPFVNYFLIAANVLVFVYQWTTMAGDPNAIFRFALVPAEVTSGFDLVDARSVLTSMFMHAGLAHIGGNMLYLWIFGDNIEDAMGHFRYLVFYLIGGTVASAIHVLSSPESTIPTVGASGAIGAVLGAYLVLYPRRRVLTLLFLGYFIRMMMIPAVYLLGFWILMQVFSGLMSLGGPDVGGVAFWAHIGGFAAGVILVRLFARRRSEASAPPGAW